MSEINKLNPNVSQLNPLKTGPMAEKKTAVTEAKFREVAEMYEKHFIREMMKEMRSTVHESGFMKQNNAEKMFREQLDDDYADKWGKSGGMGLADLIHGQLMQKYGPQFGLKEKLEKPQGPIDLNLKSNISTVPMAQATSSDVLHLKIQSEENASTKTLALKNPWAGTLLDKKYLDMDQLQYRIKHDNGLESLILTRGSGLGEGENGDGKLSVGDEIGAGKQIGWLDSSSPLFWTIKPSTKTSVSE